MQHAKKTELFSTQVVAVLSSRRALLILLVCLALSLLLEHLLRRALARWGRRWSL